MTNLNSLNMRVSQDTHTKIKQLSRQLSAKFNRDVSIAETVAWLFEVYEKSKSDNGGELPNVEFEAAVGNFTKLGELALTG